MLIKGAALGSNKVWADAKKILGDENVIDSQKIEKFLKIVFPNEILKQLSETLENSLDILKELKGPHSLFLGLPWDPKGNKLTLLKMEELYKTVNISCRHDDYLDGTDASNRICNLGLYLVPHKIREDTLCKTFKEASKLIKYPEECPSAIDILCFYFQSLMIKGEPLLPNKAVLCKDKPEKNLGVMVELNIRSIHVQHVDESIAGSDIGILQIFKLPID